MRTPIVPRLALPLSKALSLLLDLAIALAVALRRERAAALLLLMFGLIKLAQPLFPVDAVGTPATSAGPFEKVVKVPSPRWPDSLDRPPSTRYFHVSMAIRQNTQSDLVKQLEERRPKLVVFSSSGFGSRRIWPIDMAPAPSLP